MADEVPIRRVVIVCDTASDIRLAVTEGAALAARWHVELRGVFLDDENLRRLAELPFGQQVSLCLTELSEGVGDFAALTSALGAAMRRTLEEAASLHGLAWSFGSIRDLPSCAALDTGEGDMIVLEMHARPFSGAWRPRSRWEACLGGFACTVLIRGRAAPGEGMVIVLPEDADARGRVLAAAAAMVEDGHPITVLAPAQMAEGAAETVVAWLGTPPERKVRIEPLADGIAELTQRIAALHPGLVVIDAERVGEVEIAAIVSDGRCDVLLVR